MRKGKDGGRCNQWGHDGGKQIREANGNFKHGRNSKYQGVLPPGMAKHFDLSRLQEAASCREEIALVDARTAEVLDHIKAINPVGVVNGVRATLALLSMELQPIEGDTPDSLFKRGLARIARLENLLGEQAAVALGWDELHRLFDTRAKLSRAELGVQKLLSEKVLVEHIDMFVRCLVLEARLLTDDRKKLAAYATRVIELGRGAVGPALLPDVIDVQPEEESGGEG